LIDIQIAILDQYHVRLGGAIEAFVVLNSSVARAVQGVSKEDIASLAGVGGIERLCRVYGSAEFLEKAMGDWGEDIVSPLSHDQFIVEIYFKADRNSSSSSYGTNCKSEPEARPAMEMKITLPAL